MDAAAIEQVVSKLKQELAARPPSTRFAIVGRTPATYDLISSIILCGAQRQLLGVYSQDGAVDPRAALDPRPLSQLAIDAPALVLIASDAGKEALIAAALPYLTNDSKILIGGFRHFDFRDEIFESETANAFVPSFANGYPNSLIHIYQCLRNAARLELAGVVAEFGMFKGGTTMLISKFVERLGRSWKVYGFDTFGGFPPPCSPLDMYSHPDCVCQDLSTVQRYFDGRNVEIVPGNVTETVTRLSDKDIVVAFVDTDNYTSANRILDVIIDRMVVHGAIVFDHFTGRNRFLYTLGERIAATRLLDNPRFFNLHDTGVFLRLR